MFKYVIVLLLNFCLLNTFALAHQFTPTYPKFTSSFVDGVVGTKMELFNKRRDVEYYELDVYDVNWKPVPFATETKLVYIKYLETKNIPIYVKAEDIKTVVYICSESRLQRRLTTETLISSKICSKVK